LALGSRQTLLDTLRAGPEWRQRLGGERVELHHLKVPGDGRQFGTFLDGKRAEDLEQGVVGAILGVVPGGDARRAGTRTRVSPVPRAVAPSRLATGSASTSARGT